MPIRNEGDFIARSLSAVLDQDYDHSRMEVIIADGMSTDNTRAIISEISRGSDVNIKLIDNLKQIVSTGFNAALKATNGDIVIRIDGHTIVNQDYVRQCVNLLKNSHAHNVGGKMNPTSISDFGNAVAIATSTSLGVGGSRFHYSNMEEYVDTVYMGAWPRAVFEQIGGFNEELVRNQDDEFNYRLRSVGGKILLSPNIKSTYFNRSTPNSLFRQYFQYGFYKVRVAQLHPRQMKPRHFVPAAFVGILTSSTIVGLFVETARFYSFCMLLVYLLGVIVTSLFVAAKRGWKYMKYLPIVYVILHFSYGLGFWNGLINYSGNRMSRR